MIHKIRFTDTPEEIYIAVCEIKQTRNKEGNDLVFEHMKEGGFASIIEA